MTYKKAIRTTLAVLAATLCMAASAQDPNFRIYLCFGQSNMEGNAPVEPQDRLGVSDRFVAMATTDCADLGRRRGEWYTAVPPLCRCHTGLTPADYFGRTMVESLPAECRVGIINVAVGGCRIELFVPDSAAAYVANAPQWMKGMLAEYDNDPLGRLVECALKARREGVISGILMHQGESNTGDPLWTAKVRAVYNHLIDTLQLDPRRVPLLAGEVVGAESGGKCRSMNATIASLPEVIPNCYVIPSAGCPAAPDSLHFNAEGYRILGRRYAAQALSAMNMSVAPRRPTTASNPLIYADVPDMSMTRVGDTYYMSSTTMHMSPGVPLMKSTDLTNWQLTGYCYDRLCENDAMNLDNGQNTYGRGSWASCIRYHNGLYYVSTFAQTSNRTYIYSTPDIEHPQWTVRSFEPAYHDHSLFFDDDGKAYLIYGNGRLFIAELNDDLSGIREGSNRVLIDNASAPAGEVGLGAEGSQLFKVNGKYYLFNIAWPKGGMRTVLVHRADSIGGPYEGRVAFQDLGVAQGGLIDTPDGRWFAYLFRDYGAVGRTPYLVPVEWRDGWPVIGGADGRVPERLMLPRGNELLPGIVCSDEFDRAKSEPALPLAWQWNHNPDNRLWQVSKGRLRLTTGRIDTDIMQAKNTLTQRTFGPTCTGETCIDASGLKDGDFAGLVLLQKDYGAVGVRVEGGRRYVVMQNASGGTMVEQARIATTAARVLLKACCNFENRTDTATFSFSTDDGRTWTPIGGTLRMAYTIPQFIGYRFGLFCYATKTAGGHADFDYFRIGR